MKTKQVREVLEWAEGKDINPDSIEGCLFMYREVSSDILDGLLDFDACNDSGGSYLICSVYKNIEGKQGYSCIVNWDVVWGRDTPENFANYIEKLYDRAMEILDS